MARRSARERTPFAKRMVEAREAAGLTQVKACEILGIRQSTLAEIETTANSSRLTAQLATVYGVDPHHLATGEYAGLEGRHELDDPVVQLLHDISGVPAGKRNEAAIAAIRAISDVVYGTMQQRQAARAADARRGASVPNEGRRHRQKTAPTSGRAAKPARTVK